MTRQEIKIWSKEKLKGNLWSVLGAILISNLIGNVAVSISNNEEGVAIVISLLSGLLTLFMQIGLTRYLINFINGKQTTFELLFSKFKDWKQVIVTYFHQTLMIFVFTLLLIIPGIIKSYAYALVTFILADDSNISSKDALKLSEDMMRGHKGELFILGLSFLGWHLLAILTLGILEIWIIPYQQVATTKFLLDIKENYYKENKKQK